MKEAPFSGEFTIDTVFAKDAGFILETHYADSRAYYNEPVHEKYLLSLERGKLLSVKYFGNIRLENQLIQLKQQN